MCCSIGPGRAVEPDQCREDGLCYNPYHGQYWRESCTNPTWEDEKCVKLFVNGTGFLGGDVVLNPSKDVGFVFASCSLLFCFPVKQEWNPRFRLLIVLAVVV